jgi:hypothetical protein
VKKIFTVLIILGLSCPGNCQYKSTNKAIDFTVFDTAVYFSGYYVRESYIKLLKQNKSPRQSQDSAGCIIIPDSTLKLTALANFHQGGNTLAVVKRGNRYQLISYDPDMPANISKIYSNYAIDLEVISSSKLKIGNDYYDKIRDWNNIAGEILFNGKYQSKTGSTIEFSTDNEIHGLDNYKFYTVMIDYIDEARNIDQIALGTNENDSKYFAFKFKNDTLLIYDLKYLNPGTVDFGNLKYKLVKKK